MAGYSYAATMGGAPMSPQAMQGMMYGPGGSPSSPGYVDYESIYREMQLRMYVAQQQQQQQQSARAHQGVFRGQGVQPPQPPLPPGRVPEHHHAPFTAETLHQYQAMQMGAYAHDDGSHGGSHAGTWEEGDDDSSSNTTDSSKQSVARRRHARRRRQLARLAADRLEWEVRSRQMEQALLAKEGGADGEGAFPSEQLFADFRKALARALLITEEVVRRDVDYSESNNTGEESQVTSDADSEDIATRLMEELRAEGGAVGLTSEEKLREGEDGDAAPRRRSFEERRAVAAATASSVGFGAYLSTFQPVEDGWMVSSTTKGAFDPRCAGMEAVVALEHGLLKAQESGLFAPGELLITAVSTKDMLVCYAGGGCADVLGAPAEALMCTSLFDGLHAEDVRNLVFAFHLFPTILPEMANLAGAENDKPAWEREREATLVQGKERLLPLPDAARLLPHGYLRRRLADGRFIGMERLGGVIVTNDAAAEAAKAATRPSIEALSSLFGSGSSLRSVESPEPEPEPSPAPATATASGSDETAAARESPSFERPYPCFRSGADAAKRREQDAETPEVATDGATVTTGTTGTTPEAAEGEAGANANAKAEAEAEAKAGDAPTLDKYPPALKRDAKPNAAEVVTRSGHSAPAGSTLSAVAATFSPAAASEAASTVAPGSAGAKPSTESASAEGARAAAAAPAAVGVAAASTYKTAAGDVVLNKYHPSKKREARSNHRTTEAEVSSLVAHCVRHTEKAAPGVAATPSGGFDTLPEGIKDVLRRLTRETFSDNTTLVTIERVRGIGGNHGGEARHNSQMMVVSKLLNDLATRRHRAMTAPAA